MNIYEKRALKWISLHTGYPIKNIKFSNNTSPDFTLPDGTGYEVKKSQKKWLIFSNRQWDKLANNSNYFLLIFTSKDFPDCVISLSELGAKPKTYKDYKFRFSEYNKNSQPLAEYLKKFRQCKVCHYWQEFQLCSCRDSSDVVPAYKCTDWKQRS